jgi:hypothetical protein
MTVELLLFVGVLIIALVIDGWQILELEKSPDHKLEQFIKTAIWLILAVFLNEDWRDKIMYFLAYHFAFGFPFDILLNLMRKKEWNYIGNTAWTDKLGRKWPGAFWPFKFILFLIGMGTLCLGTYW